MGPIFFGPGAGNKPGERFDSLRGKFGVLYTAPGPESCLIETLLRFPHQRMVAESQLASRSLARLEVNRDLRFVDLTGPNLSTLGTTGSLHAGPYDSSWAWSDALFDHPSRPDGILYTSRHDPSELCMALFEKPDYSLTADGSRGLLDAKGFVGAVLSEHGKSIS